MYLAKRKINATASIILTQHEGSRIFLIFILEIDGFILLAVGDDVAIDSKAHVEPSSILRCAGQIFRVCDTRSNLDVAQYWSMNAVCTYLVPSY